MKALPIVLAVLLVIIGYYFLSVQMNNSNNKYNTYVKQCMAKNGIPFVAEKTAFNERVECYAYKLENK